MAFSFSVGMGGLPAESVAVLTTFPSQRVEEFYANGTLDREDPDDIVRALARALGHDPHGSYADSLVASHACMRYEFKTGLPF